MEICFLGTSSGTPTKSRNVSAIAVTESKGSNWYLIDCGEGTQHQLLHSHLSLNSLCAICITHIHGDHCYGLPGLLASAGMNGRRTPLLIIAPKGVKEWFEATQSHTQLFLPFEVKFMMPETLVDLALGQFTLSTIELSHRVPSFAYVFEESNVEGRLNTEKLRSNAVPQGPIWGQLISGNDVEHEGQLYKSVDYLKRDRKPRKIIICGDNDKPELIRDASLDCHVIVHEATYTEDIALKIGDVGHSYAKQVAQFAQDNAVPSLILTHFSPRYQTDPNASSSIEDIRTEAKDVYDGSLYLAKDFDTYRIDKEGKLTLVCS